MFLNKDKKPNVIVVGKSLEEIEAFKKFDLSYSVLKTCENTHLLMNYLEKEKPNVLVLHESFLSNVNWTEVIMTWYARFPTTIQLIYVLEKEDFLKREFLYAWSVFDVIIDGENEKLVHAIQQPKAFSDVIKEFDNFPEEFKKKWKDIKKMT